MQIPEFRRQKFFSTSAGVPGADLSGASMAASVAQSGQQVVKARNRMSNQLMDTGMMINQRIASIGDTISREMQRKEKMLNDVESDSKAAEFNLEYNRRVQSAKQDFQEDPEGYEARVAEIGAEWSEEFLSGIGNQAVKGQVARYSSSIQAQTLIEAQRWANDRRVINAGQAIEKYMDDKVQAIGEIPSDGRDLDTLTKHISEIGTFIDRNGSKVLAPEKLYEFRRQALSRSAESFIMRGIATDPERILAQIDSGKLSTIAWGKDEKGNLIKEPFLNDPVRLKRFRDEAEREARITRQEQLESQYLETRQNLSNLIGGEDTPENIQSYVDKIERTGSKEDIKDAYALLGRRNDNKIYRAENRDKMLASSLKAQAVGLTTNPLTGKATYALTDFETLCKFDREVKDAYFEGKIDSTDFTQIMNGTRLVVLRNRMREKAKQEKPNIHQRVTRPMLLSFARQIGTNNDFDWRSPYERVMHDVYGQLKKLDVNANTKADIANDLYDRIPALIYSMDNSPGAENLTAEQEKELSVAISNIIENSSRVKAGVGRGVLVDHRGRRLEERK